MIYIGFSLAISLLNNRFLGTNPLLIVSLCPISLVVKKVQKTQGGGQQTIEFQIPLFHIIAFVNSH